MTTNLTFNRIKRIAINEIRDATRDGRLLFLSISLWIVAISSLYIGFLYYKHTQNDKISSQKEVREIWLNQSIKHPHGAGHFGHFAFKPLSPFNMIDKGINPYVGGAIRLETHLQNAPEIRQADDSTFLLRSGELTLGFIFLYIVPILIIVLSYGTISKEREQETIKLAFCQGITKTELFLGKTIGIVSILAFILLPIFILIGLFITQNSNIHISSNKLLVLLFVSYIMYFLIFLFISIGISAINSTSRKALLTLFSIWILICVVIPKVAVLVSEQVYPATSAYMFTENIENENKTNQGNISYWKDYWKNIEDELKKEFNVSSRDSIPINILGYGIQQSEEAGHEAYEKNYESINNVFRKQNKVHNYSFALTPHSIMRFIMMGIASSNVQEQFHFINSTEDYRRNMMTILNEDIMKHQKQTQKNSEFKRGKELWHRIPEYVYKHRDFKTSFSDYSNYILILFIWCILSFLFSIFSIKKLTLN